MAERRIDRGEHLTAVRDGGKPAIFLAGHLANSEINALAANNRGLDIHLVYRKPNNPWVDGLLRHARNAGAAGHIRKGAQGAREILSGGSAKRCRGYFDGSTFKRRHGHPFFWPWRDYLDCGGTVWRQNMAVRFTRRASNACRARIFG